MPNINNRSAAFGVKFNCAYDNLYTEQDKNIIIAPGEPMFLITDGGDYIITDGGVYITTD